MLGIDIVQLGTLMILASSSGNDLCKMPQPTDISVVPSTQKVELYTDRSLAELQSVQTDTLNPHSFGGISVMQGYAKGSIKMSGQSELDYKFLPRYNAACIWYKKIEIKFDLDPSIHIAEEVYKDRCMRKAVYDHEMKHVMTDRKIVNKYSRVIGQKVLDGLKQRGFMVGPVPAEQAEEIAKRMNQTVQQLIQREAKRMELDRMDAQTAVDSREEYERVSSLCPDFEITPEMLEAKEESLYQRSRTRSRNRR